MEGERRKEQTADDADGAKEIEQVVGKPLFHVPHFSMRDANRARAAAAMQMFVASGAWKGEAGVSAWKNPEVEVVAG